MNKENAFSNKHKILAFTLTLLTFVMGTSEFVIVGLLTEVSTDLSIPIATAGSLISGFAIAYAIGTPILTGFVSRFAKYPLMLVLISLFILGNIVSALSSSYGILITSKVVTAVVSGVLTALAMSIANDSMPKEKRSSIIAFIFVGFTIANVMGVPLGTMVGQWSNWHMTFWLTAALGGIAFIISMFVLPRNIKATKSSLSEQLSLFKQPKIILAFFIPVFTIAGTYTIYTFITPILQQKLGIETKYIGIVLLIYGFFSIFSNLLAGKIAQHNGLGRLRYTFIIQAIILFTLYFTMSSMWLGLLTIMLMAVMLYAVNATVQLYFMDLAERYSPSAKDFASSLTPVAVNVGIALGSAIGGFVVASGSLDKLSWAGGILALIASVLTFMSYRLNQKDQI
ncbi:MULTISPECIES: MFS transporter [Lysinibacillus]|uniref:MFS transporter n=2 Tax=Bacillaceae TaxID=186817 RepID=UPI000738BBB7|nr:MULTISPECIES: MFS transporter [unclassified Lysinibacillus]KUF32678.1 MFS transporter [Lysinibacillus sp. F5]MEE3806592.1 MFS transporter [Lysinibacillus fusiformis]